MRTHRHIVLLALCAFLPAPSLAGQEADVVAWNGVLHTMDAARPRASALAIRDGEILYVGDDRGARAFIGAGTRVIDLGGRFVLPGLQDVHAHLLEALHPAFSVYVPPGMPLEKTIGLIAFQSRFQVGSSWVIGWGHSIATVLDHIAQGGRPPNEILDDAVPDRPCVILRDPRTGRANGILLDGAGEVAMDLAFAPNPELDDLNYVALLRGLERANAAGITSYADARVYWRRRYHLAYERALREGTLTARVTLGFWAYPWAADDRQIAALAGLFARTPGSLLQAGQVKIYTDGELGHTTAALEDPYVSSYRLAGPRGLNYFDETRLTRYITELERVGFDFHIHAIGDRGVHEALNAIAAARAVNGGLGARHRLTHLEVVDPADVPRFAALGVAADMQMSSDFVELGNLPWYREYLGLRRTARRVLRLRDLHDAGARVVLSSDYDVGDLSPFQGMERALTRGRQSLPSVDDAIRAYTLDAAWVLRQEDRTGSLEVGKRADLVVVDRDITAIPSDRIGETRVLLTVLDGRVVWRASR